jgi:WD40 repeat protein
VAFSPNGKQVATASRDDTIRLWDIAPGTVVRPATRPGQPAAPIAAAPPAAPVPPAAPAPPARPPGNVVVVPADVQAVAGTWRIGKTITVTLLPNGGIKTGYGQMRNGTWVVGADKSVLIRGSNGEVLYTLRIDQTGKSGTGKWKDGNTAKPQKLDE